MSYSSNPKGDKAKPQDPNKLKKAKMDYLEILRGNTGGNVGDQQNLKHLTVHERQKELERQGKGRKKV